MALGNYVCGLSRDQDLCLAIGTEDGLEMWIWRFNVLSPCVWKKVFIAEAVGPG